MDEESFETRLYGKRWAVLFFNGFVSLIDGVLRVSFGVVNNIYVAYFQVPYETVDWFTLINLPGVLIFSLLLSFIMFNKLISLRKLAILMSTCMAFTCACLVVSYAYPRFYPLIMVGEFTHGFVIVALDIVSAAYAINWFPEHQMGIALGAKEIGVMIGAILGFTIPSNILYAPNCSSSINRTLTLVSTQVPSTNAEHGWFKVDQTNFIIFTSVLLTISLLLSLGYAIFIKDNPPFPPTIAQAKLQSNKQLQKDSFGNVGQKQVSFLRLLQLFKVVILNRVFLQVIFILIAAVGINTIVKVLMGQILRNLFIYLGYVESYTSMSGFVLICIECGCIVGGSISAKLVNRFKNYHKQISMSLFSFVLSAVALLLGYYFKILVIVFIFSVLFGIFLCSLITPLYEVVFQQFYPADSGILSIIIRILYSLGSMCLGIIGRQIFNFFNEGISVLIFIVILLVLSFIVSLFLKPSYNRLAARYNPEIALLYDDIEQRKPLLSDENCKA